MQGGRVFSLLFALGLREEMGADYDTSYVMRLPDSGGALIDGKPYADAIRANPANPSADGCHVPLAGAAAWGFGAGAMANDPRDKRRTNALLAFVKPAAVGKAVADLAVVRPVLLATRQIEPGEEVFYSYGSNKPFERLRQALQAAQQKEAKGKQIGCKLVWREHGVI